MKGVIKSMRGIPAFIQTPADLDNLVQLAIAGEAGIDKAELAEKIHVLLELQYSRTPILSIDRNVVKTRLIYEAAVGATTKEGLTVTNVLHTPHSEQAGKSLSPEYGDTEITLSEPLADGTTVLSLYKPTNFLTANGFSVNQITEYLGVLNK
jgi:hypothetical protein